jgi:hypothetical protein
MKKGSGEFCGVSKATLLISTLFMHSMPPRAHSITEGCGVFAPAAAILESRVSQPTSEGLFWANMGAASSSSASSVPSRMRHQMKNYGLCKARTTTHCTCIKSIGFLGTSHKANFSILPKDLKFTFCVMVRYS